MLLRHRRCCQGCLPLLVLHGLLTDHAVIIAWLLSAVCISCALSLCCHHPAHQQGQEGTQIHVTPKKPQHTAFTSLHPRRRQISVVVTGHPQQQRQGQQNTTISTSTTALMHLQGRQMTSEQQPMSTGLFLRSSKQVRYSSGVYAVLLKASLGQDVQCYLFALRSCNCRFSGSLMFRCNGTRESMEQVSCKVAATRLPATLKLQEALDTKARKVSLCCLGHDHQQLVQICFLHRHLILCEDND